MSSKTQKIGSVILLGGLLLGGFVSCLSSGASKPRSLSVEVAESARTFFEELAVQGTSAQAYFTLFVPHGTVNKRHAIRFREALENGLRSASAAASMHYNASADRIFFLSEHKAPGWETPTGGDRAGAALADEFRKGTPAGWTILNAFWAQYNRLLIGDDTWIQNLPESVRADLAHPLRYVVRVNVTLDSTPDMATYIHRIHYSLIEVGREVAVFSVNYPFVLTFPLN